MIRHAASITSLLAVVALFLAGPARAQGTGEWLTFQHDFQRTGRADGVGAIVDPAVAWSIPLGGMLTVRQLAVADLDGDGEREVVGLKGSRVQALRSDGTLLWTTATSGHLAVYGIWDVDGDGSPEVLVNSDREARLLSASTGQILGRIPSVPSATATFVPGAQGGLIVVGAEGSLIAYDPTQDLASPPSVWTATFSMRQAPIAGDVDGDGGLDLVVPTSSGYALLDPSTGTQKGPTLDLGGCFPQLFQLADVDGQPGQEIVALDASSTSSPNAGIRVMVWRTGRLEILWSSLRAAAAVHDYDVAGPLGMVADLDGDGTREVVYSEWDRVAGSWTTRILDAATGAAVSNVSGRIAQAIADIDGDGKLEIVTKATSRADGGPVYATIEAFDVDSRAGGAVAKSWSLTQSRLLSHSLPASDQAAVGLERPVVDDLDPAAAGLELVVSRDSTGAGEGTELLILHGSDGTTARQLPLGTSGGLSVLWFGAKLSGSAAVGDLLLLGRDGVVRIQRRDGTSRGEFAMGSYAPAVTVARALSNTFAGISPESVVPFVVAQVAGALLGTFTATWLFHDRKPPAGV